MSDTKIRHWCRLFREEPTNIDNKERSHRLLIITISTMN